MFLPAFLLAQNPVYKILEQVKAVNADHINYNYRIDLYDAGGRGIDSIKGQYYRSGASYIDSNSISLVALKFPYYCKVDYELGTASVYDIRILQKRLNLKVDLDHPNVLAFPDSIISRYGKLAVKDTDPKLIELTWTLQNQPFDLFKLKIDRSNYTLLEVLFETTEKEGSTQQETYRRRCTLYNIEQRTRPEVLDLNRIFTVKGTGIVLTGKFAKYKLKTFTN